MSPTASPPRLTKADLQRSLCAAHILLTRASTVADPAAFLREHLDDNAIVVVEKTDAVTTLRLRDLRIDEKTLHVHGFSSAKISQARAARTGESWHADAVRECADIESNARKVLAQSRTHMCLGKQTSATNEGVTMAEARIKPYTLPIASSACGQHDITYINYFEALPSGRLVCIAHRVTGIVAREIR